jgi:hypothetical protein
VNPLPVALTCDWEYLTLAGVLEPEWYAGEWVYDLDRLPLPHLRWLCRSRVLQRAEAYALTGTDG